MSNDPQPIRVVHVVLSLAIGGLEAVVVHLAGRATRRCTPHILCLESVGPLAEQLGGTGVPVECIGAPALPVTESVRRLRRRLRELNPQVIHTHNEKAHIHGALATLGWRVPLVHTRHGRGQVESLPSRLANRLAVRRTRFIACVSADAVEVARAEGASPDQLRVLLNAIDVKSYDASRYQQSAGTWTAVTVARLAPVKDIATMLRAARVVRDAQPTFRLHIVGDGQSRPELEQLTRSLGLDEAVTFHGATTDPRPFLALGAVFLQSSISEGISLTLLEAMAAGLPIVATRVGGNGEVVEVGETGFLVSPQDAPALAAATLQILGNPTQAAAMSRAARQRAERLFDIDRMVAEYESLYEEAAG
ncbi:MAG: glycosyltransferase [Vicinamibacterales bacterium]